MAGRIPNHVKARVDQDLEANQLTQSAIAERYGVSEAWVKKRKAEYDKEKRDRAKDLAEYGFDEFGNDVELPVELQKVGAPKRYDELRPEAQRALEDIDYFARRYYGVELRPWQRIAFNRILELLDTPFEEYLVINVAPGAGKTEAITRILPAWLTCRDRSIRGMIGSATSNLAAREVELLAHDFVRDQVMTELSLADQVNGLHLPESTLPLDFGAFKTADNWRKNAGELQVQLLGGHAPSSKEKTWTAFGRDMNFLGYRVRISLWDDLQLSGQSGDNKEKMFRWWDSTVETRLEPRGLIALVGQRLDPNDIYRYALDKPAETEIIAMAEKIAGAVQVREPGREGRKYHHIVFKAYDETKDTGDIENLMGPTAKPWPEGPLLAPDRITWPKIKTLRLENEDNFQLVYQQNDADLDSVLVRPQWIEGGTGPDGEELVGCRDDDRALWEVPKKLRAPTVSVAMTDPSHTKYWASHWYLWEAAVEEHQADVRHLMATDSRKMMAPEFLDFNSSTGTYSGQMEEWWQVSNELGHPIRYWIVEKNGAQRYLLQYDHVRKWMALRNVQIYGHTTGRIKHDPDLGVQTLGPVYRRGLIRLPMADTLRKGAGRNEVVNDLIRQVTTYPDSVHDDMVMAQWFFEANMDKFRPPRGDSPKMSRPGFLKAFELKEFAA